MSNIKKNRKVVIAITVLLKPAKLQGTKNLMSLDDELIVWHCNAKNLSGPRHH